MSLPAKVKVVSVKRVENPEGPPMPRREFQRPAVLPSAAVMAGSLLKAGLATGLRLITGKSIQRTEAQQAECLAMCRGDALRPKCAQWIPDADRCGACGCFVAMAVRVAGKDCPLGKWPVVAED